MTKPTHGSRPGPSPVHLFGGTEIKGSDVHAEQSSPAVPTTFLDLGEQLDSKDIKTHAPSLSGSYQEDLVESFLTSVLTSHPRSWTGDQLQALWEKRKERACADALDRWIQAVAKELARQGFQERAEKLLRCRDGLVSIELDHPEEARTVPCSCWDRLCPYCYHRQRLRTLTPIASRIEELLDKGHFLYHVVVNAPHVPDATAREQREQNQTFLRRLWRKIAFKKGVMIWIKKFEGHRDGQGNWNEHAQFMAVVKRSASWAFRDELDRAAADHGVVVLPKQVPIGEIDQTLRYLSKPSLDQLRDYVTRGLRLRNARDVAMGGPSLGPRRDRQSGKSKGKSLPRSRRITIPLADLKRKAAEGEDWAIEALGALP